jgi:hypothetical protein
MKQSTIFWIWLIGGLVWVVNSAIQWRVGSTGHALITLVVAALFFGAAFQARRKSKLQP